MWKITRTTLGPLFLIITCPLFAIVMWYTNTALSGSFAALGDMFYQQGIVSTLYKICQPVILGSPLAWLIISVYTIFQLVLMQFLPGKTFKGVVTPNGNIPVYKANGVLAFLVTIGTYCLAAFYFHLFSPAIIYDNLGSIIGALNIFSLVLCAAFYLKGRYSPSSSDNGITGNIIFDYYWGTELYPKILNLHLKKFITCRFGMMSWAVILISYMAKQYQLYGYLSNSMIISVALQIIYIAKFYVWETGYLCSLDMMHDRAGFYICWGCMVWVPCIYTAASMYLVLHPIMLSAMTASVIFVAGVISIFINYFADRQRQLVRLTKGNCKIWGKKPNIIVADYQTEQGEKKSNILLTSGWWGITRHFHYIPEILAAFCWTVPALFVNFSPYFYVVFLTVLLFDRAFRDDKRCAKKYGTYWQDYCTLVPYKIIPLII
ncbi:MAG: 7-dehydrocholesterol reductase [Gammaproteobacteria bacterium]|nr:7-dehydrocholesterol reductase [Gammaproteobacteria bacterium]